MSEFKDLFVNPDDRGVFVAGDILEISEDLMETRRKVDSEFTDDPISYLATIADSVRTLGTANPKQKINYSIYYGQGSDRSNQVAVMLSPLNDCAPQSEPQELMKYIDDRSQSKRDRERAQPNGWRQGFKSADVYHTFRHEGLGMPVVTIYSPVPSAAFSSNERQAIGAGITSPYAAIVKRVISAAQTEIHGTHSETQLSDVHLFAPGLGHNAVGAALHLQKNADYHISGLTLPNLIAGVPNKAALLARYSVRQHYREPGIVNLEGTLPESTLSTQADANGSERAMRKRQLRAMLNFEQMTAMMKSEWIGKALNQLLSEYVAVTLPTAYNARITSIPKQH
jgi:hypothetical protein